MNVLFFLHRYWPHVGGVEKYVRYLAHALHARGHVVTVIAGDTKGNLPERAEDHGVRIHRFPASRSSLRCRLWLWKRRRVFLDADVIQVSNTYMLEYLWRMLGPVLDRRRIFLTRHGYGGRFPVPQEDKNRARRSLHLASGFVHDGAYIERWLDVAPDVVPEQGLYPLARDLPFIPPPPPKSAVYIGRLEPDTGVHLYLDGLYLLGQAYARPLTLHVYGDGSLRPELHARAERERLPVVFHGTDENAQERLSEHALAFVNGRMAIQEAMARRRAVIAAYTNPLRRDYLCGESFSPYLITVGSASELAEQATRLMDHPREWVARVERAFDYACRLTWDATARAFEHFWESRRAAQFAPLTMADRWSTIRRLHGNSVNALPSTL